MDIRDCTVDDLPWMLRTAKAAYPEELWDDERAAHWAYLCVHSPAMITMRGPGVCGFAQVSELAWSPPGVRVCALAHLFGTALDRAGMETMAVVRAIWERAQGLGCHRFYIESIYADLTPIAKRLHGRAFPPTYVVEVQGQ